ncbi:MAG: isoleucine--tRNA ligase [Candidatus Cloacimonetes bacterium]|nr:isoleucine--tRNA ligase [Candidatus Cloacimonadota bacterium]MCF7813932.1 isoleucine--tRNA ligase [Candidatus Cloacimonadota bacterium]MCF7868026.1 isoleucine--tRNA ligase [Candidatus Cloacimonadota bacterium]
MYKTIDMKEKSADLEKQVREYWIKKNIAQKSEDFREGSDKFVFFEGPPTANGMPGIHHVMSRTQKDTVCRYKTMKGFQVKRKAGWDTHGLPVEIEVEKQLGLKDKKEVEEYGLEKFNKKCQESVFSYEKEWREMTKEMGYWINLDDPYITLKNDYIETVWWILNDFYKKGLIYKGHKIVPYCPSCGTPLSSHEVAQGYRETEDPSVFVKFKAKAWENTYFLAWTTTPWTLISNVALVVHPTETYVKVKHHAEFLILAKARLDVLDDEYEIVEEFAGKDLEYKDYEQLFPFVNPDKKAFFIGLADYVTMEDGTGVVHTAPAFGQDDYELGQKYDLPVIQPVDEAGKFKDVISDWKGEFVKDADKGIIKNMNQRGVLYKRKQIVHSYPFCWRCDSPLIYYARSSWYIKTSEYKQQMIENNKQIKWYPPFVGEKRFGEWLENNVDWAISRNRFWGTPLNIWVCQECGEFESAGSIEELREKGVLKNGEAVPEDIELHRPYVDEIEMKCKCGGKMLRTPEVIDCWFDSGSMPFAQWHYPFENKERFEKELFPADFISEGIDQTRGWFYSLLAISTMLTGKSSYKACLVNDLILDKKGQKMSKSKGNSVNPIKLMDEFGADAIRWYLLAVSPPWIPTKFDENGVKEIVNKFFGTLKNVYSFYVTYANIDKFDASKYELSEQKSSEIDKWIMSRLNSVTRDVTKNFDNFDLTKAVRSIQGFVIDDLSNWYVRRSRRRYWELELTEDKIDAYLTLYQVLVSVTKLMAPVAPFLAEEIFTNLTGKESVHLEDFPTSNQKVVLPKLEEEMQTVIDLVSLGRAARNTCQIKVRQTLGALYIPAKYHHLVQRMESLIKEEINVKEIKYIQEKDDFVKYEFKPNFKVMGPKYGKHMKRIAAALQEMDADHIVEILHQGKDYFLEVDGSSFKLTEEDLIISIKDKEGFVFETNKDLYVALDTHLTPELIQEGLARELVNKIQYTRKESGLEIMDRIKVFYCGDNEVDAVFSKFADYIQNETLTNSCHRVTERHEDGTTWDVNGKEVWLAVTKD